MIHGHTVRGKEFSQVWMCLLDDLLRSDSIVSPRGLQIRELTAVSLHVEDGLNNVLDSPSRNLSYKFMLAEWLWIITGRNDVQTISLFNKNSAKFSDDGLTFFGAYGPMIRSQINYLIDKLVKDPDTRQAVLSIWRPNPPFETKDVPCTLTYQVLTREGKVHSIVNMRSSDIWLGLPYDFFNFSMLTNLIASAFELPVGNVTFNLGSSHLYHSNFEAAQITAYSDYRNVKSPWLGKMISWDRSGDAFSRSGELLVPLQKMFNAAVAQKQGRGYRETLDSVICSPYYKVLLSETNQEALDVLASLA